MFPIFIIPDDAFLDLEVGAAVAAIIQERKFQAVRDCALRRKDKGWILGPDNITMRRLGIHVGDELELMIDYQSCKQCGTDLDKNPHQCPYCRQWFCQYHIKSHVRSCPKMTSKS